MALPTFRRVQNLDVAELPTGREGRLYLGKNITLVSPSMPNTHKAGIGGKTPIQGQNVAAFARDGSAAVAKIATVKVNSIPAVGKKIKLGPYTISAIANGGTPVDSGYNVQYAVGTTANLTAAALNTKIGTLTSPGATSTVSTDTLTITAATAGQDFDLYTDDTTDYTITISTANTSAKGYLNTVIKQLVTFAPTAQTITEMFIDMPIGSAATFTRVFFGYYTQTSDTYSDIVNGLIAVLSAGLNKTDPTLVNGYIDGLDSGSQTSGDLQTAMQNLFGSTASVAFRSFSTYTYGDTLQMYLTTASADCTNVVAGVQCWPSSAGDTVLNILGQPTDPGWVDVGPFKDFKPTAQTSILNYVSGTSINELNALGSAKAAAGFSVYSQLTQRLQAILSGFGISITANNRQLLVGSANNVDLAKGISILFVFQDTDGTFSVFRIHAALVVGFEVNFQIESVNAVQINATPIPFSGRVDKIGCFNRARIAS